jgi:hypothetical protein
LLVNVVPDFFATLIAVIVATLLMEHYVDRALPSTHLNEQAITKLDDLHQRLDVFLKSYEAVLPPTFIRNLSLTRDDKLHLAVHIVQSVLSSDVPVFVDGGTTLYYVALAIRREKKRKIPIVTNNLPLALTLCEEPQYPCVLIAGVPEREYAAILGKLASSYIDVACGRLPLHLEDPAVSRCVPAKVLLISGTHCSFSGGLWGRNHDDCVFKRELLRSFQRIVIAVSGHKVVGDNGQLSS